MRRYRFIITYVLLSLFSMTAIAQGKISPQGCRRGTPRPDRRRRAGRQAEGRHPSGLFRALPPQQPHHQTAAPHAEEIRQGREGQENRQHQGAGGHHKGIVGAADKPGVRYVVHQRDELAGDRRDCHDPKRPWNANLFK